MCGRNLRHASSARCTTHCPKIRLLEKELLRHSRITPAGHQTGILRRADSARHARSMPGQVSGRKVEQHGDDLQFGRNVRSRRLPCYWTWITPADPRRRGSRRYAEPLRARTTAGHWPLSFSEWGENTTRRSIRTSPRRTLRCSVVSLLRNAVRKRNRHRTRIRSRIDSNDRRQRRATSALQCSRFVTRIVGYPHPVRRPPTCPRLAIADWPSDCLSERFRSNKIFSGTP